MLVDVVLASTLRVRSGHCRPATPRVARFRDFFRYFFARMTPLLTTVLSR